MSADRFKVSLSFKLSKSFNSIGGEVSFESDRKEGETSSEHFYRVFKEADKRIDEIHSYASKLLDSVVK